MRIIHWFVFFCFASTAFSAEHLVLLSGQSNMVHMNHEAVFTPVLTKLLGSDTAVVLKDAHGGQPIGLWADETPAEIPVALRGKHRNKELAALLGNKGSYPGIHYDALLNAISKTLNRRAATEFDTVTLVWMQGESDAKPGKCDVYGEALRALIAKLHRDLGRGDLNVVIGRLSDHGLVNPEGQKKFRGWQAVRDAQQEFTGSSERYVLVDTDDLNGPTDTLHYNEAGHDGTPELGKRFATAVVGLVQKK